MDINNIVTKARQLKAEEYNREALYKAMRGITGGFIPEVDLKLPDVWQGKFEELCAVIYRHCSSPAVPVARTKERWVSLAVNEYDRREVLQFVYSDGERIIGTDGHRLHVWKTDKYGPGYYRPGAKLVKVHEPGWKEFHNVDRILDSRRTQTGNMTGSMRVAGDKNGFGSGPYDIYYYDEGQAAVNADYLEAVMQRFPAGDFCYESKFDSIKFEDGDLLAVLMPIRI